MYDGVPPQLMISRLPRPHPPKVWGSNRRIKLWFLRFYIFAAVFLFASQATEMVTLEDVKKMKVQVRRLAIVMALILCCCPEFG